MKQEQRRIELASGEIRHTNTLRDDPAPPEHKDARRGWFLQTLADNPQMLRCGPLPYESMHVKYADQAWQAYLEATEGKR